MSRRFSSPGQRKISAVGFASDESPIAGEEAEITVNLADSQLGDYQPPSHSLNRLGDILLELEGAERIHAAFSGGKALFKLPVGQLYIDPDLDLDTDGSRFSEGDDHQAGTSLEDANGRPLDADIIPYFVLPGPAFAADHGIRTGDIGAIIFGDKIEFAIYGDNGPTNKIGEASIEVHRTLGFERIRPNGTVINAGIDANVITIVFPLSR